MYETSFRVSPDLRNGAFSVSKSSLDLVTSNLSAAHFRLSPTVGLNLPKNVLLPAVSQTSTTSS